jgi:predicted lipoprotein
MRPIALALAAFALTTPAHAQVAATVEFDPALGARLVETYVAPAADAFVTAATALATSVETLCASPSPDTLAAARAAFAPAVSAWGGVWFLRFGPLADENRADRVFFWPDARGLALRQVQAFIADPASAAVTAADMPGKSVALQGLPALDFVLFGTDADTLATPAGATRCAIARAVSGNLVTIGSEIAEAWAPGGSFAEIIAAPGAGNPVYRTAEEVAREALKAATNGLEFIRDGQLGPALGESADTANGRRAPLWRSQATGALLIAEVDAIRLFLDATGLVELLPPEQQWLGQSITFELKAIGGALARIAVEPELAVRDEAARGILAYASIALQSARANVINIAAGLGLGTGFSAAEGGD